MWSIQVIRNQRNTKDLIKNINYFVVITVPVDVLNKNVRISTKISVKFVPKGQINKKSSTGSANGEALTRRQVIIWSIAGIVDKRIYASLGLNELSCVILRLLIKDSYITQYTYAYAPKMLHLLHTTYSTDRMSGTICWFLTITLTSHVLNQTITFVLLIHLRK